MEFEAEKELSQAVAAISSSRALLITAGAGMGVDSGLPDFRGAEGFWNAYPPYRRLRLRFEQLANPYHFTSDPHLAWGFYGHRLHLYQRTVPHEGFAILKQIADAKPLGSFVFTSNVDGQFAVAGFDSTRIVECHGSIHHLQCSRPCCDDIWPADSIRMQIDQQTMRAADPLPRCANCNAIARPNILMFGDSQWIETRTEQTHHAYEQWLATIREEELCIIECGAGTAIPTVRLQSEYITRRKKAKMIRINLREPELDVDGIELAIGARDGLVKLMDASI